MAKQIEADELLATIRVLDKKSTMKSAEVVANVDIRNVADGLLDIQLGYDDRPIYSINKIAAGTYTAMMYEYAFNGLWGRYDMEPIKDAFHHLAFARPASHLAELMLCSYYEKIGFDGAERHRLNLQCVAQLAEARSKLDFALHEPESISPSDEEIFGFHFSDRDGVTLSYQDVSLLSGVSVRSLRNLSSGKNKVLHPMSAGRESVLRPQEVNEWLRTRSSFKPTQVIGEGYWQIVERDVGPLQGKNFLEFPIE